MPGSSRRRFLKGAAAAAALGCSPAAAGGPPPDVVLLLLDDCPAHVLGCYGAAHAHTPNIDRLAASGLRFDAAHVNSPVCNPSRMALLTGRLPMHTQVHGNGDDWRGMGLRTFITDLRERGYRAIRSGKVFHFDDNDVWSRMLPAQIPPGGRPTEAQFQGPLAQHAKLKQEGRKVPREGIAWASLDVPDHGTYGGDIARRAAEFLERDDTMQPAFLGVGLIGTHLPWVAPKRWHDHFAGRDLPLPVVPPGDQDDVPVPFSGYDDRAFPLELQKEAMRAFYAALAHLDHNVGLVLDAIERSGRADQTIVVLWSDHGLLLGAHGYWGKSRLYQEATRIPFIVRAPGVTTPGTTTSAFVESVDVFPTVLDLLGYNPLPDLDGRSFLKVLRKPNRSFRIAARSHWGPRHRSIVTPRYRATDYGVQGGELFDHLVDPGEFTNLASAQPELLARFIALLDEGPERLLPGADPLPKWAR